MALGTGDKAMVRTDAATEMRRAREELDWVADHRLGDVCETKEPLAAAAASFVTGGGGQLYVGETLVGLGLTAAWVGTLALTAFTPLGLLAWAGLGTFTGVRAYRQARSVNRYVLARAQAEQANAPHPAAYRLLAAMSQVDPAAARDASEMQRAGAMPAVVHGATPAQNAPPAEPGKYAELVARLHKLASLRASGVLSEVEHASRKIDALSSLGGVERDEIDDLLYELLPLVQDGTLTSEDVDFIKDMGR